jgi:signal transduction histidine kinase
VFSPKNTWSITLRLIGSATIWIIIPLMISLVFVAQFLSGPVIETLEIQIKTDLDNLVRSAEFSESDGVKGRSLFLDHKRYAIANSGWYAQVIEIESDPIRAWRSPSMNKAEYFPIDEKIIGAKPRILEIGDLTLMVASRKILNTYNGKYYLFTILSEADSPVATVNEINKRIFLAAFLIVISIFLGVFLQVRFGLRPLSQLRASINNVKDGKLGRLDVEVAKEIRPVADALNELFHYSDEILEKARSEVGNLAHSLKTPITIIKNELENSKDEKTGLIADQLMAIERHVNSYLEDARGSVLFSDRTRTTALNKTVLSITAVLTKAFPNKDLEFSVLVCEHHLFRGSKMHLDDMLGNVMENACKWCESKIKILSELSRHPVTGNGVLSIVIEDDGPGIPADDHKFVLGRGNRADNKTPGSGIGLDIVRQISSDYGGELLLGVSEWGGLKVTLNIPGEGFQAF